MEAVDAGVQSELAAEYRLTELIAVADVGHRIGDIRLGVVAPQGAEIQHLGRHIIAVMNAGQVDLVDRLVAIIKVVALQETAVAYERAVPPPLPVLVDL